MVQLKDGRQYTKMKLFGKELMQDVFDGKELWGTNLGSWKPEKANL